MLDLIEDRSASVTVIGAGYVGLPLALAFARTGFRVQVYDHDEDRIAKLKRGESYIEDVKNEELRLIDPLDFTTDRNALTADIVIVCVPTPLNKTREPDHTAVLAAADEIVRFGKNPQLVILESTTFPGFTREVLLPKLEVRKLDRGFWLAFSPERIDPGNKTHTIGSVPKVVGGCSKQSLALAQAIYSTITRVVPVSSTDTAEMTKLVENTFRAVNIALINEVAIMCKRLGVDTREVVDAAATKPFGFMPFYPGPGIGGHCIPIDPLYLSWKLRTLGPAPRFIELADEINRGMPEHVVGLVAEALNDIGLAVKKSRILIVGVAYKRDISDTRESPALDIIAELERRGAVIDYCDVHVPELGGRRSTCAAGGRAWDCGVIVTDHSGQHYELLPEMCRVVVDTRGVLRGVPGVVQL